MKPSGRTGYVAPRFLILGPRWKREVSSMLQLLHFQGESPVPIVFARVVFTAVLNAVHKVKMSVLAGSRIPIARLSSQNPSECIN
jgi:hypothetical protein